MRKNYFYTIFFSFILLNCVAQIPVMNPISGPSNVCSSPAAAMNFSASATNSPTSYQWTISSPSVGVVIGNPTGSVTSISFPYSNGTYTLYCSATNGFGTSPTTSFVVNIFETPTVTFSGANSFCQGSSTNLQASATILVASPTITYSWTPNFGLNAYNVPNVIANPSVTTTYTVIGTKGFCSNSSQITVSVLPTPTLSLNITNTTICLGNTLNLVASGANSYTWTGGITNGITFSPSFSNNYTVTGAAVNGCKSSAVSNVSVNPPPSVIAHASSSAICSGLQVTLYGTGASTYSWTSGVINNSPFSPTVTASYTVTGSTPACPGTSSNVISVTVNPTPTLSVNANRDTICTGQSATLTVNSNANNISVNGTPSGTNNIITPSVTTTYTITGTNGFGCSTTHTLTEIVTSCAGIKSNTAEVKNISIYPNPANGSFTIKSGRAEILTITNELGETVKTISLDAEAEVRVSGLSSGIYLLTTGNWRKKVAVIQ